MKQKKSRTRFKQILITYLLSVKKSLFAAALCTLALAVNDLLRPWPLKIIFDYILLDNPLPQYLFFLQEPLQSGKTVPLIIVSLGIVAIAVLKSVFSYSQLFIISRVGYKLAHTLRSELFSHLQRLSLSYHKRLRSGEVLTKITNDTNTLKDVFTETVLDFISESIALIGMVAIMLTLNWKLSMIVLATFPVLVFISFYRIRRIRRAASRLRKEQGKIASRISEVFNTVSVVQAFGREKYEERRFRAESVQALEESVRTARLEAAAARAAGIISALGTWGVVLFGALEAVEGRMSPGNVLIFASYANSLYGPIKSLTRLSTKFSKATVSAQRISEILDVEPQILDKPDAVKAEGLRGEIVFDNVAFHYGDHKEVLKEVGFTIAPGQHVALVGPSGAGKTTLAGLILRFFDPHQGSITVDGVDIKDYQRDSLRREIGIVLQESILFGTTIKENIAYGKLDATMDEIVEAAKAANAHDFIMELEDGYNTTIGERGETLSGGQRQRIAIARAFIRDVPILILDEPMTGLDVESEAAVRDALARLMCGRTCLLITHDLQAVVTSDFILMIEDGRIVDRGKHDDLMERSERYRQLHDLKFHQAEVQELSIEV
jgi:ABC-type multidrug transport system fused ATPase/permease subunit